jgi:hypothetical protein
MNKTYRFVEENICISKKNDKWVMVDAVVEVEECHYKIEGYPNSVTTNVVEIKHYDNPALSYIEKRLIEERLDQMAYNMYIEECIEIEESKLHSYIDKKIDEAIEKRNKNESKKT